MNNVTQYANTFTQLIESSTSYVNTFTRFIESSTSLPLCVNVAMNGILGAFEGYLGVTLLTTYGLTTLSPMTGLIFGATFEATHSIAKKVFDSWVEGSESGKKAYVVSWISSAFVSLLSAKLILDAVGIAIASDTALVLGIATGLVGIATTTAIAASLILGLGCCLCCCCCYSFVRPCC